MPIKLMAPVIQEFELTDIDEKYGGEGDPTIIMIRQATQREHEKRATVFNRIVRQYRNLPDGFVREIQELPWTELGRREVFLVLANCNILDLEGKPLFVFKDDRLDMTETEFVVAWGKLPSDICLAIHTSVLEVNMTWDPEASEEEMLRAAEEGAGSETEVPLEVE